MTADVNPIGLVGRALAALGALVWIGSLFLDVFSGFESKWEVYDRADVVSLALAAGAVVLLLVSLAIAEELMLLLVGVIGGWLLGFGVTELIEVRGPDIALGGYLAVLGPALVVVGAVVALVPALSARSGEVQDFAFMPTEASSSPAAPAAGWYPDPSGQTRLRYWDGHAWSEQTQE